VRLEGLVQLRNVQRPHRESSPQSSGLYIVFQPTTLRRASMTSTVSAPSTVHGVFQFLLSNVAEVASNTLRASSYRIRTYSPLVVMLSHHVFCSGTTVSGLPVHFLWTVLAGRRFFGVGPAQLRHHARPLCKLLSTAEGCRGGCGGNLEKRITKGISLFLSLSSANFSHTTRSHNPHFL
jgi:hypothetical protein